MQTENNNKGRFLYTDRNHIALIIDQQNEYHKICFDTPNKVEIDKILLHIEMLQFAKLKNKDWEPNWYNGEQRKYGISFVAYKQLDTTVETLFNIFVNQIAFKTEEIAMDALFYFAKRIKELYLNQ
jgi:hypothetical protein